MNGDTWVIVFAVLANIVTTVGGIGMLISRLEENSRWKGSMETKVRSNCQTLKSLGAQVDDHETRLSRHEGAGQHG